LLAAIPACAARQRVKYPDRARARLAVTHAIAAGRIVVGPCSACELEPKKVNGRQRIEAHHHKGYDEEHWLDVVWLCRPCHREVDSP
jgi:predicted HNH restriction endonuclease